MSFNWFLNVLKRLNFELKGKSQYIEKGSLDAFESTNERAVELQVVGSIAVRQRLQVLEDRDKL